MSRMTSECRVIPAESDKTYHVPDPAEIPPAYPELLNRWRQLRDHLRHLTIVRDLTRDMDA